MIRDLFTLLGVVSLLGLLVVGPLFLAAALRQRARRRATGETVRIRDMFSTRIGDETAGGRPRHYGARHRRRWGWW